MCSLGKTLLAFDLLRFVRQGQIFLFPQVSWLPTFAFQFPIMKRTSFLGVSSRSSCKSIQFSRSVVSNSLWPHGLQHTRPPCPSPTPRDYPGECLVGLVEPFNFFSITDWGIESKYCNTEWFALETNREYCVVFKILPENCTSESVFKETLVSSDFFPTSFCSSVFLPCSAKGELVLVSCLLREACHLL